MAFVPSTPMLFQLIINVKINIIIILYYIIFINNLIHLHYFTNKIIELKNYENVINLREINSKFSKTFW